MTIFANIANLSLKLGYRQIFSSASLTINEGDKIGVLGLNGHGKSTLFKILTGEMAPDITNPSFIYDKNSELSYFYVPQDLIVDPRHKNAEDLFYSFYPKEKELRDKIFEINKILETDYENPKNLETQQKLLEAWDFSHIDIIYTQFLNYLNNFQFTQLDLPIGSLSGGEKRKIALALGLSAREKVILWDEPTNHLDLETIEKFEDELSRNSKTFLIISHDRELLHQVSNRIIHISNEQIQSFQGTYQDYLLHLQDEELHRQKEESRLKNQLRRETAWIRQGAKARSTKSKKRIQGYSDLQQGLTELKNRQAKTMSLSIEQAKVKSKKLLEGIGFEVKYGDNTIIKPVDFIIASKTKIALMGGNGSGKSTLVKALTGEVSHNGVLKKRDDLKITYFNQNFALPDDSITPYEYVGEGREMLTLPSGRDIHIYSYLDDFLFSSDEARRPMSHFSGGEKKRLQLAKFLLKPSELMIFDEPSNDLDLESIAILEDELTKFTGPIILITHDRQLIQNTTHECWQLTDGTIDFFTAGYDQWLEQQEINAIEASLKNIKPKAQIAEKEIPVKSNVKLTNKQKMRLKTIHREVEQFEAKVMELEMKLESFDYETNDIKKLTSLTQEIESSNATLQMLYEEKRELDLITT